MEAKNLTRRQIQELIVEYTSAISKLEFQISTAQKTIEDLEKGLKGSSAGTAKKATKSTAKRKPGRPKKKATSTTTTAKRKPGRPKKTTTATKAAAAKKPAKRRGRPPKAKTAAATTTASTTTTTKAKRGPGRPRKAASAAKTKKATTAKKTAAKKTTAKKSTAKKTTAKKTAAKKPLVKKLENNTSGYRLSDWDALVIDTLNKSGSVLSKQDICDAADKWAKGEKKGMDSKQVYTKVSNVLHKLTNKKNILNRFSNDKVKNSYGLADWFTPQGNLRDEHLPK